MSVDDFEISKQRIKDNFNKETRIEIYSRLNNRTSSIVEIRQLEARTNDVRTKAKAHYEKNRDKWIDREVGRITNERLIPSGVTRYQPGDGFNISGENPSDPEVIQRDAQQRVEARHYQRMERIGDIQERMTDGIISHSQENELSR